MRTTAFSCSSITSAKPGQVGELGEAVAALTEARPPAAGPPHGAAVGAQMGPTEEALLAVPAVHRRARDHVVAGLHAAHGSADRLHHPGRLVAHHRRHRPGDRALQEVQVAVTHAAGGRAHEHLVVGRVVDFDLLDRHGSIDLAERTRRGRWSSSVRPPSRTGLRPASRSPGRPVEGGVPAPPTAGVAASGPGGGAEVGLGSATAASHRATKRHAAPFGSPRALTRLRRTRGPVRTSSSHSWVSDGSIADAACNALCGSIPMITDMTVLPSTWMRNRGGHSWFKIVLRASFEPHHGHVRSSGSTSFGSQPAGGRQFMSKPDERTDATNEPSRQAPFSTRQFGVGRASMRTAF